MYRNIVYKYSLLLETFIPSTLVTIEFSNIIIYLFIISIV
jgi:hypothetical protein